MSDIIVNLAELDAIADIIIIDTGAGISSAVMEFLVASGEIILVTTPEPTSITDSYSLLKALNQSPRFSRENTKVKVVSNRVSSADEGQQLFNKLNAVVARYLKLPLSYMGAIPHQYIIKIKGIQVSDGEILFDHYMAMNPGHVEEEITGIPTFEPSFHLPAIWITEGQRERAESFGYTVVDPPSIIATHLTEIIREHIAELLTRQDVQNLVDNLKENNHALVDELVPKLMSLGEIEKVLQNLRRGKIRAAYRQET